MKRLSLPVLALSLFLTQSAAAQSEEGPFYSRQHLVDYWSANASGSSAIHVFLNMYQVYSHFGFGPALGKAYFQCADGLIRKNCNSIAGPFLWANDAVAYVDSVYGGHSHFWMLLDGMAFVGVPFGPVIGNFHFRTCYGQSYNGNLLSYVVLEYGYALGTTFPTTGCLPQP
jgi:hypothetical protein